MAGRRVFTGQVVLISLAIDLAFAILMTFAYLSLLGIVTPEARALVLRVVAVIYAVKTVTWVVLMRIMLRPVEAYRHRDRGDVQPEVIRRAGRAIYNVPILLGTLWSGLWGLNFLLASMALLVINSPALPLDPGTTMRGTLLFAAGPLGGSMAVIFPMLTYFMAPMAGRISLVAREHGVRVEALSFPFHIRIIVLAMCLSISPACWMGGMAYMFEARSRLAAAQSQAEVVAAQLSHGVGHLAAHREISDASMRELLEAEGTSFVADASGHVVYGSNAALRLNEMPRLQQWLLSRISLMGDDATADPRYGQALAYRKVQSDWIVGTLVPVATEASAAFTVTIGIFSCMILLWAPVVAFFLVQTVAGPIARIAGAMHQAAEKGDPGEVARLPIPQQDEIGLLAAGVNDMFDRLTGSAAEIRRNADDLAHKNEALVEAARMKSQFLANMSHELRTPLNAIIGFARIVGRKAQGKLDETQLNNLRLIHQSGQQLLTLVNDMLDFERIESGKLQVVLAPADCAEIAQQVYATLLPAAEKKGLALAIDVARQPLVVETDADRLRQILINLLHNAIKYSDNGRILFSVTPEPSRLVFRVQDEGIGIPPEHLQKIFDPFYQVDPSSTREREGAGLGLAIVQKLAHLLGGNLAVKSEAGKGTTFTLDVPMPLEAVAEVRPTGPLVLIIDDEIKDREILRTELSELGYRVETAASGTEGLARARSLKPAAIVLDLIMQDMPGLQVLQALRQDAATAQIPVVVATVQDKVHHGYDPGITAWLTKPIETEDLRSNLRRALNGLVTDDVLVVEDDEATRQLIEQELTALHYRVRTAPDAASALAAVKERVPQAVILDLMLPGMDGFELLQQLRGQQGGEGVPVVIYTGRDLSSAEQERLSARLVAVVRKHGEKGVQGVVESLTRVFT